MTLPDWNKTGLDRITSIEQHASAGGGGGSVNSVAATDSSITVAGSATDPTIAVATGGITSAKVASSLLSSLAQVSAVVKPSGDTTGATDTAAIQAKLSGIAAGGTVWLTAGAFYINATLTIAQALTLRGESMSALYGALAGGSNIDNQVMPTVTPFLQGTVLNMVTAATDAIHLTGAGQAVHLRDIGIVFGASGGTVIFQNTGHGIKMVPPSVGGGYQDQGTMGAYWENVIVYGTDGNHYSFFMVNPELCTFNHLQSFGGGGLWMESNGPGPEFGLYGNCVFTHHYFVCVTQGTSAIVSIGNSASNQFIGLNRFYSPQHWLWTPEGQVAGLTLPGPIYTTYLWRDGPFSGEAYYGTANYVESPDFETSFNAPGQQYMILKSILGGSPFIPVGQDIGTGYTNNLPGGDAAVWGAVGLNGSGVKVGQYFPASIGQNLHIATPATATAGSAAGPAATTIVAHTHVGGDGVASSGINTTGATLLVAAIASYMGASTITDSKSNTWVPLTDYNSASAGGLQIFYCTGGTVGSGHTFTAHSNFPGMVVAAFNTTTGAADLDKGAAASQPGSGTPAHDKELVLLAVANNGSFGGLSSSFTSIDTITESGGTSIGCGLAYQIQGAATAVNPTWAAQNVATTAMTSFQTTGAASVPAPVIAGTVMRGAVTFGTGSSVAAGDMVDVVAGSGDPVQPLCPVIIPTTAAAVALGLYVSAQSLTGFSVAATNAPSTSQANTVYGFNYHCIS